MQRLGNFQGALSQLSRACERGRYNDLERAGLIKIFELCFKLSWNVLKDLLSREGHDARVPRAVIRKSFAAGHIDERDCETLLEALDKRNTLSHAYRKSLALEVEALIRDRYHPVLLRLDAMLRAKAGR